MVSRSFVVFALLSFMLLLHGSFGEVSRIRKNWNRLSNEEKDLYFGAVQKSMESGSHLDFTLIHLNDNTLDYLHAHATCGFLLWHRRYILAYENMLRSMGPQFANLTVPYWNYFEDAERRLSGQVPCNSIESCSLYLQDMGGSAGEWKQFMIGDRLVEGNCVTKGVTQYACANVSVPYEKCENKCVLRGDWALEGTKLNFGVSSLVRTLNDAALSENPYVALREGIEEGFHARVHDDLNGTMQTRASTFDPVFFGHHAMVDLVVFLFNRCYSSSNSKSFEIFDTCLTLKNESISSDSPIRMFLDGKDVKEALKTKSFFERMGETYTDFINAEEIGYTYEMDSFLQSLIQDFGLKCPSGHFLQAANQNTTTSTNSTQHLTKILAACGQEIKLKNPKINSTERIFQQSLLECALLQKQSQDETLPDISTTFRQEFMMHPTKKGRCLEILDTFQSNKQVLLASKECLEKISKETDTDLIEFFMDQDTKSTSGSQKEHGAGLFGMTGIVHAAGGSKDQ